MKKKNKLFAGMIKVGSKVLGFMIALYVGRGVINKLNGEIEREPTFYERVINRMIAIGFVSLMLYLILKAIGELR